jgi:hypothetical protein
MNIMNKKIRMLCFASSVVAAACTSQAASSVIYSNGFESGYVNGALLGQDSWAAYLTASPTVTNGTGVNTSKVIGNSTNTTTIATTTTGVKKTVALDFAGATTGSFSIDIYRNGNISGYMGASIGASTNSGNGIGVYAASNVLKYRDSVGGGTIVALTDINGNNVLTVNGAWSRITLNLDFANNQITSAWLTNLTTPGAPTQLYFGAGNATKTYLNDESSWNQLQVRTDGYGAIPAYLDNILLAGPEPKKNKISLVILH